MAGSRVGILSLHRGGMHHYSASLISALKADDHTCEIAYFGPQETDADVLEEGVTLFTYAIPQALSLTALPRLARLPWTAYRITQDIKGWKPDVLHVSSGHVLHPLILGSLASRVPIVSTLHEVDRHLGEQQFYRTMKMRSLLRNSRAFVVHSQGQKARMQEAWDVPEDKIWHMPLPRLDCLTHYQAQVAQVPCRLLFFGRIYAYKGYDTMLRALPLVAQSFPGVELVIAGEGDLSPWQMLIEKAGCHVDVINRFIPDREVLALFRSSVLAVAPYHEASQSGIVSLAMCAGVPVVASKVGTIPDMITDRVTGRLVPPADVPALAKAIIDMLAHPRETERLGEALRKDSEGRFGAKTIGGQLHAVYDAVASNRETGPSSAGSGVAGGGRSDRSSMES